MDKTMGIMAVMVVIGLLLVLAVYRFFSQRRQLSSGFTPDGYKYDIGSG